MDKEELVDALSAEGYSNFKFTINKGLCAIHAMNYTVGLFYGLDEYSYLGRYCYHTWDEAAKALKEWDGSDDPSGNWMKHKGAVEYSNPKYNKVNN